MRELLKNIAKKLEEVNIPYMVIGGQAVLLYGLPRLTEDIDITLGIGPEGLTKILNLSKEIGLIPICNNPHDFVLKTFVLPCKHIETSFRVDFIFSDSKYEKQALKRVKMVTIDDVKVKFASIEDLIIHKIIAGRPRDIEDIKAMILKNPGFDKKYILNWLKRIDAGLSTDYTNQFLNLLDSFR